MSGLTIRGTTKWLLALSAVFSLPIVFFIFLHGLVPGTDIYAAHLADLVLEVPLLSVTCLGLFYAIRRENVERCPLPLVLICFLVASVALLFEGHGIHFAANSVAAHIDTARASRSLARLNFFYDEQLGHWMLLTGLSGVLLAAFLQERHSPNRTSASVWDYVFVTGAGIWSGLVAALIALESRSAWLVILMYVAVRVCSIKFYRGKAPMWRYPVGRYIDLLVSTAIAVLCVWLLWFHSFVEPIKGGLGDVFLRK